MSLDRRRTVSSWRSHDGRAFDWRPIVLAVLVLSATLFEVWRWSTVASMSAQLGEANRALAGANADLDWAKAELDRASSRTSLGPLAAGIGLKPADPRTIVSLPEEYLESSEASHAAPARGLLASAGRVMQLLVPEAMARGRHVN